MKTIQRKYETAYDKDYELLLGQRYQELVEPTCTLHNLGFLATYDFRILDTNGEKQTGWLEVKKKSGFFYHTEIIPITKWRFAQRSPLPCFMLVERDDRAVLFNITRLIETNRGYEQEITRRADQPEGSRKVVRFPVSTGRVVWYL